MTLRQQVRRFERTAPVAVLAAGLLLMVEGGGLLQTSWAPATLALTHLATLGFASLALMGVVYARAASFAGAQLPGRRAVDLVYGATGIGVIALVAGLLTASIWPLFVSLSVLMIAIPVFAVGVLRSLRRVRGNLSCDALRIALGSLLISAAIGIWMLHGHAGMLFPGSRPVWLQVHLSVALLGWFGGAFASLCGRAPTRLELSLLVAGVVFPPAVLIAHELSGVRFPVAAVAAVAASPAVVAVCAMGPFRALRSDAWDAGLDLRRAGFAFAPGAAIAAVLVAAREVPDWNLLLGWIALWGWAGLVVHGLLLRDSRPGSRLPRLGLGLHLSALAAGTIATLSGGDLVARTAGLLLVATGACLLASQLRDQK
jgi:hypothetical protein